MEIQKALKTEQYDLSVYATYNDDEPNECEYNTNVVVFTWDVNAGAWGSVGCSKYFKTPNEAWDNLVEFMKTFEGF